MRVKANTDVVACSLESGAALLDLRSSKYFALNATAAAIWEKVETGATLSQLAEMLAERFDASSETCASDVERIVEEMAANQLVVISDDA